MSLSCCGQREWRPVALSRSDSGTIRDSSGRYLPEQGDVKVVSTTDARRAKCFSYFVTDDEHINADGVEVYGILIERTDVDFVLIHDLVSERAPL
jgi:hypothetical protein